MLNSATKPAFYLTNSYIVLITCQALFIHINSCNLYNCMKCFYYPILEMRKLRHRKAGCQNSNHGSLPPKSMLSTTLLPSKRRSSSISFSALFLICSSKLLKKEATVFWRAHLLEIILCTA